MTTTPNLNAVKGAARSDAINAIEEGDISYEEYAQSYQALLEQFELVDEV